MVNLLWENILKRNTKEKSIKDILQNNFLFQDLRRKELQFVLNIVHIRDYRTSEKIFQQSEVGVGMYIIVTGRVDIEVENFMDESPNDLVLITRLGAGDFFGELSLVETEGRRTASATAAENTRLIGFFKPDLIEILDRNPAVGVKIVFRLAEVLGRRLKETTEKVTQLRREMKAVSTNESSTKNPA